MGWGFPNEVMQAAKQLKVVSFTGIGAGNFVDFNLARELGVTVCNCPGYSNNTVAEHALMMLLGVARHVGRLDRAVRAGNWDQSHTGIELHGKTIGLVGFGGIGQTFARMCQALGMKDIVCARNMSMERAIEHGVEFVPLELLCEQSDVISVHATFNAETENLIDANAIDKMKDGVLFINTARAELVKKAPFVAALRSGKIAAAGLDVFWNEPLAGDHPVTQLDNVLLSPHVGFNTAAAVDRLFEIGVDNIVQYCQGKPINVVA